MALLRTVDTPQGFVAVDAFHRVEGLSISEDKASITFRLRSYKSESGVPAFVEAEMSCPYDLDGPNPHTQAYAYIKGLEEWAGSADV